MNRTIEQAPSPFLRWALSRWLEAVEGRRDAYRAFCEAPDAEGWDCYVEVSDAVLEAEGHAHAAIMALPPVARHSIFVVNGRFAWLMAAGTARPSLFDADSQLICTCRNCHGAGRNVYLFRDGTREGTCFICGGSGRSDLTPPIATRNHERNCVMSKFPEIFAKLTGEFQRAEVKTRSQGGKQFQYITARTVMNRLDYVLGPENWWDEYVPQEHSVLCRLSIRLPDGEVITKSDAGGYAGMSDQGDDDKSGYSDAFKRAAVKFGVGRYLYCDGVPEFRPQAAPLPVKSVAEVKEWASRKVEEQTHKYQPRAAPSEPIAPGEHAFQAYLFDLVEQCNDHWALMHSTCRRPAPKELTSMHALANWLGSEAERRGLIALNYLHGENGTRDRGKLKTFLAGWYRKYPDEFRALAEEHLSQKLDAAAREAGLVADETDDYDVPAEVAAAVDGNAASN